ncbi:hypothetical protein [Nocardioides sp. KR10-350]|uniref:MinD/ParA family ATP-binding protein n=1 Tax=Nocardioides cheoyonin TaxID=3156615 RepID=UPI0032B42056
MTHPTPGHGDQPDPLTDPIHSIEDTVDRPYTPEELEAYAAEQAEQAARAGQPEHADRAAPPSGPPSGPPPSGPPAPPPGAAAPPPPPLPQQPAEPEAPAPRAPAQHSWGWAPPQETAAPQPAEPSHTRPGQQPVVAQQPPPYTGPAAPQQPYGQGYPEQPYAEQAYPELAYPEPLAAQESGEGDVRRFMTATDFLDRRADTVGHGPATWGWRGAVRRMSGGLIKPSMGRRELEYEQDRASIQRDFDGPRTIAFINPKGGAAKTTGVLAAGFTFGTVRGGGVVAWDNNETRGTLGIRGTRSTHRNTTRELLEDLGRFSDVYQSRIGDLGAFVRSQGDAHFDVLASDERPDVTGQIHADDFDAVHKLLERFYRVILIDTGNNMRAENWLAAANAADLLVVTSTVREDTGYSGLWMLDALQESGYANLKYKTITVLSDPSHKVDDKLAQDLVDVYQQRTRGVYRVPFDPILVGGSTVQYSQLSRETRMSWLKACAAMSQAL